MLNSGSVCWHACADMLLLQGNVRGLLGSLQTVLWEGSGWVPIGMADLLEPAQVGWWAGWVWAGGGPRAEAYGVACVGLRRLCTRSIWVHAHVCEEVYNLGEVPSRIRHARLLQQVISNPIPSCPCCSFLPARAVAGTVSRDSGCDACCCCWCQCCSCC